MERPYQYKPYYVIGYHSQEHRIGKPLLNRPMACLNDNAWLGQGYYFWTETEFARYWGEDSKSGHSGYYDIYRATLNCTYCINAVFDEQGYNFFSTKILETIQYFKDNEIELTLEGVNRFLADKVWPKLHITGILYDDKPRNPRKSNRIYSEIPELYYRKRIQVVLFNLKNI